MIRVRGLRKSFGNRTAVDGVAFEVREGEIVGFLGPNGAGKTTTMRMLTTFLDPDEGEIEIDGIDAVERPLEARRRLGYLPESAPLLEELGVLESLRVAGRLQGLGGRCLADRIDAMVAACGLERVVDRGVSELSKGYRQRLGLAQALLHDPPFLILDEPTTGLDPNQIEEIRRLVRDLGRNKTVLLSTHILPEVQATCTRVLILHDGRIVADDDTETLSESLERNEGVRLRVRIVSAEPKEARAALAGLTGVRAVEVRGAPDGTLRCDLRAVGEETADRVFRLAASRGWTLRELAVERRSLEEVFRAVTGRSESKA